MKRNYQGVLERIKAIAESHPQVNSADDGRELEFDVNKTNIWPRVFIRTDSGNVVGGDGTVELSIVFTILVMDRLNTNRSNVISVMNQTHSIMTDILATLSKEQLIYVTDNPIMTPLYDYQDSQSSGWQITLQVYLDQGFQCYPVSEVLAIIATAQGGMNSYVDIGFSDGIYSSVPLTPVAITDFAVYDFVAGDVTGVTLDSVTKTNGSPLTGGETQVRINISFTGLPDGTATFFIGPATGNSIFDFENDPMPATERTDKILFIDPYIAEFRAVLDFWIAKPTYAQSLLFNSYAIDLVGGGEWYGDDVQYVFSIHTNANGEALTNWKNPGTLDCINHGCVFTAFQGFRGDGIAAYLESPYVASVDGVNYTNPDAGIYIVQNDDALDDMGYFGVQLGTIMRWNLTSRLIGKINFTGTALQSPTYVGLYNGYYQLTRKLGSIVHREFLNMSELANTSATPDGVPTFPMFILGINNAGVLSRPSPRQVSTWGIGSGRNQARTTVFGTLTKNFLDSIGLFVIP